MKKAFFSGLYWICWPLIWLYVPIRKSARILVIKDDSFLVIKPYFGNGKWQLPGGGIKIGEDPSTAAQRELYEELGITVKKPRLLIADRHFKEQGMFLRYEIYVVRVSGDVHVKRNHEIASFSWLKGSESVTALPHVQEAIQAND